MLTKDFYSTIFEELQSLYSLNKENPYSSNTLYKYLYIRCAVNKGEKKVTDRELANFILSELNISVFSNKDKTKSQYIVYNNTKVYVSKWRIDFIDNLRFRAGLEGEMSLKPIIDDIFTKGYRKAYKYKQLKEYKEYIKYYRLIALNEKFNAKPSYSAGVEGFKKHKNHNAYKRSMEEKLQSVLQSSKFLGSHTTSHINEEQLEDYIVGNIGIIEEGMNYLGRQIEIPGGIIDILGKDKNNNICVIELKISEDKSLVWQAIHYPKEIGKRYNTKKVRMITVAPSYSKYILEALKEIKAVEVLSYTLRVSEEKIQEINIQKKF